MKKGEGMSEEGEGRMDGEGRERERGREGGREGEGREGSMVGVEGEVRKED